MLEKLVSRFKIYPTSANKLKEYIEWWESLDDKYCKYHPLCGVVDLKLKTNYRNCWKFMLQKQDTAGEWSNRYYQRIYEHLDELSNREVALLCKLPHIDEAEIPMMMVFDAIKIFKKIGYTVYNENRMHLLDIEDSHYLSAKYVVPKLGEYYGN